MKFIRTFDKDSDYLTYRGGTDYTDPNVSYSRDTETVHYNYPPISLFDYVDLGLPSGTKWATMNVGASKPSDYGLYFQWGDTLGYTKEQVGVGNGQKKFASDWSDYKWYLSGNEYTNNLEFKKYTTDGATLELEDDAAHAHMGGNWHMPSPTQIQELLDNTTTSITTSNGVSGITFTSKNGESKSIFIPAAGHASDGSVNILLTPSYILSSTLGTYGNNNIQILVANDDEGAYIYNDSGSNRYYGIPVRGVVG